MTLQRSFVLHKESGATLTCLYPVWQWADINGECPTFLHLKQADKTCPIFFIRCSYDRHLYQFLYNYSSVRLITSHDSYTKNAT